MALRHCILVQQDHLTPSSGPIDNQLLIYVHVLYVSSLYEIKKETRHFNFLTRHTPSTLCTLCTFTYVLYVGLV